MDNSTLIINGDIASICLSCGNVTSSGVSTSNLSITNSRSSASLNSDSLQIYRNSGAVSVSGLVASICLSHSDCLCRSVCTSYAGVNRVRSITCLDRRSCGIPSFCCTIGVIGKRATICLSYGNCLSSRNCTFLASVDWIRYKASFCCSSTSILRYIRAISVIDGISSINLSDCNCPWVSVSACHTSITNGWFTSLNSISTRVSWYCRSICISGFATVISLGDGDSLWSFICASNTSIKGIRSITSLDYVSILIPGYCRAVIISSYGAVILLSVSDSQRCDVCAFLTSIRIRYSTRLNSDSIYILRHWWAICLSNNWTIVSLGDSDCLSSHICTSSASIDWIWSITCLDGVSTGILGDCGAISIRDERAVVNVSFGDSLGSFICARYTSIKRIWSTASSNKGFSGIIDGVTSVSISDCYLQCCGVSAGNTTISFCCFTGLDCGSTRVFCYSRPICICSNTTIVYVGYCYCLGSGVSTLDTAVWSCCVTCLDCRSCGILRYSRAVRISGHRWIIGLSHGNSLGGSVSASNTTIINIWSITGLNSQSICILRLCGSVCLCSDRAIVGLSDCNCLSGSICARDTAITTGCFTSLDCVATRVSSYRRPIRISCNAGIISLGDCDSLRSFVSARNTCIRLWCTACSYKGLLIIIDCIGSIGVSDCFLQSCSICACNTPVSGWRFTGLDCGSTRVSSYRRPIVICSNAGIVSLGDCDSLRSFVSARNTCIRIWCTACSYEDLLIIIDGVASIGVSDCFIQCYGVSASNTPVSGWRFTSLDSVSTSVSWYSREIWICSNATIIKLGHCDSLGSFVSALNTSIRIWSIATR